ncbi:hypothetical protein BSKO_10600 [Bryopsis sp. KO-2023]|nr:hypothetical protein BSKO_10600 [Bryopsis sp. KO-2023]
MLAKAIWLGFAVFVSFLPGGRATPQMTSFDVLDGARSLLPLSAHVIVEHYGSSCGGAEVPFQMDARIALMCNFIASIYRDCLGSRRPMFIGRNCRGQSCVFDFTGPNAICLYRAYGQPVHPSNKALASTCGIETDDPSFDYLTPRPLPPLGESLFKDPDLKNCGHWLPQGISGVEWTECVGGVPIAKMELTFQQEMPADMDYHCLIAPTCGEADYIQHMLCYVDLDEVSGEWVHSEHIINSGNVENSGNSGIGGGLHDMSNGIGASPVFFLYKVLTVIVAAAALVEFTLF